jgi:ribosomal protein S6--L-glutamate ligase
VAAVLEPRRLAIEVFEAVTVVPYDRRRLPDVLVTAVSTEAPIAHDAITALAHAGVPVVNPPGAVLAAADKHVTARLLQAAGVPHPRTTQVSTVPAARAAAARLGWPVVVKALDGSQGEQVVLVAGPADLDAAVRAVRRSEEKDPTADTPVLVQELVAAPLGRDRRIVVAGGLAVAAIERVARPGEWRSNLSQGAQPRAATFTRAEASTALAAVRALGLDLGTVDVLRTPAGPVVLEVNSFGDVVDVTAFTGIDVVGAVADLVEAVAAGRRTLGEASRRPLPAPALAAELAFCRERLASKAVELAGQRGAGADAVVT